MLPCVIAEGGSVFFISSTSTGAASKNMSRIFQNRKNARQKDKEPLDQSFLFLSRKNIQEVAPGCAKKIVDGIFGRINRRLVIRSSRCCSPSWSYWDQSRWPSL